MEIEDRLGTGFNYEAAIRGTKGPDLSDRKEESEDEKFEDE